METLRVVQAIVKIQALVRARQVQAGKLNGTHGKDKTSSRPMVIILIRTKYLSSTHAKVLFPNLAELHYSYLGSRILVLNVFNHSLHAGSYLIQLFFILFCRLPLHCVTDYEKKSL